MSFLDPNTNSNLDPSSVEYENQERQDAELEFCRCAYSPDEAWITSSSSSSSSYNISKVDADCPNNNDKDNDNYYTHHIHRRLNLPLLATTSTDSSTSSFASFMTVELILSMPRAYPSDTSCTLKIEAQLSNDSSSSAANASTDIKTRTNTHTRTRTRNCNHVSGRKIAMNAIPSLLLACRDVASEHAGEEAVFVVLSRADEWVDVEWTDFCANAMHESADDNDNDTERSDNFGEMNSGNSNGPFKCPNERNTTTLSRKLIYSHHIIAKTKRKAIGDLARDYRLGGYAKIGWPGIIIIEGEEDDCNAFIDEIRTMRWQHLVVRGEEHEMVSDDQDLDKLRKLPLKMEELAEDQMSYLSSICRDAGMEDLFMTSMKIYKQDTTTSTSSHSLDRSSKGDTDGLFEGGRTSTDQHYGSLVLVDHMNDKKGYRKWIQKACKSTGCSCEVRICHQNNDQSLKPIIFVGLVGDECAVKQVLKRWRTSRVDVDSKGNPCLERMMKVLVEGNVCIEDSSESGIQVPSTTNDSDVVSIHQMESILQNIGGAPWVTALHQAV